MKWLSSRYAYPLVVLVLVVSILLQLAWLTQLFRAQRSQVKRDLEDVVSTASKNTMYTGMVPGHENSPAFKEFFMSPEWLQFRQAYTNMRFKRMASRFSSDVDGDSTVVSIRLSFRNRDTGLARNHSRVKRFDNKFTKAQLEAIDKHDLKVMDSLVNEQLDLQELRAKAYYILYSYDYDKVKKPYEPENVNNAAYVTQRYTYNLHFLHTYQLVIPNINGIVIYRMRYYLLSSCFLILLTGAVFYFILKLMQNQQLYAKARQAFTSNMTHELKTPVATVSLALETIIENGLESDPTTLRSYLEISRSELRRLDLMIEKVLDLEKTDSGRDHHRTELLDVQPAITQVIASLKLQIENNNATVNWQPLDEPCFVSGDPTHLTNVFYNLTDNALKYGGKDLVLDISCKRNAKELIISFKDNGPGISAIYHNRIFERFFRVPEEKADIVNVKGSGLGLNYVKQTIEKHGGHIKLQSEPGRGSNFIIYLPLAS